MKKKVIIMFLIFLLTVVSINKISAETAEELKLQIDNANRQIELLDREIKKYQNQIAETAEQANTLANLIRELNTTRSKLIKEKEQTEKKIQATNLTILKLSNDIDDQQNSINNSRETLSRMIKELNWYDNEVFLEKILSKKNLAEISREYNSIISINENIRLYVDELELKKQQLNISKDQKEEEHEKLTSLKKTLSQKEQAVLVAKNEKNKVLVETKNQQAEYQKILDENKKKMAEFEKAIEEYEAKLQLVLNPKYILEARNGILSWPLKNIIITSTFGERIINGVTGFHNGVDFRASVGTSVLAMSDGVVVDVGNTDLACRGASLGKWVFIKYDNGLSSAYGHLSSILVKKNQKVKSGEVVALSGNTGYSTGPHLHVSIFASDGVKIDTVPSQSCKGAIFVQPMLTAKNARLDPLLYLPKATVGMFKK